MSKITIIGPRLQDIAGFKDNNINREISRIVHKTIEKHKNDILLTSCALGIEMWACESAIHFGMPIELIVPCEAFASKWPQQNQKFYQNILKKSNIIESIKEPWSGKLMYAKDKFLCERADHIFHFYNTLPRFIDQSKSIRLFKEIKDESFFEF